MGYYINNIGHVKLGWREGEYYCQICNEWHPPRNGQRVYLDAHSLDRSHTDAGMCVCRNNGNGNCHDKIHKTAQEPEEVRRVSETAAQLAGLAWAYQMIENGEPERRIRRLLNRRPY